LEHGDLLSEGEDFEGRVASTAEEDMDHGEDGEDEYRHELTLVTWRDVASPRQRQGTQVTDSNTSLDSVYTQGLDVVQNGVVWR
jgi:hypothetical protein